MDDKPGSTWNSNNEPDDIFEEDRGEQIQRGVFIMILSIFYFLAGIGVGYFIWR